MLGCCFIVYFYVELQDDFFLGFYDSIANRAMYTYVQLTLYSTIVYALINLTLLFQKTTGYFAITVRYITYHRLLFQAQQIISYKSFDSKRKGLN